MPTRATVVCHAGGGNVSHVKDVKLDVDGVVSPLSLERSTVGNDGLSVANLLSSTGLSPLTLVL